MYDRHVADKLEFALSKKTLGGYNEFKEGHASRYATFGFNDTANLDEGAMWPNSFALNELTEAEEKRIEALVKKAVS